jgi:sarcosine oxidase, subunit gamma
MAERDTHRSPLAGFAGRLAAAGEASGGALALGEVPFLVQVDLRIDPKSPAAGQVGLALGVALPVEPGTSAGTGDVRVLWLGPDEWLVVGPDTPAPELEARLRAAAGLHTAQEPASVVDVSAQRTTLLVAGPRARDLLAHGCSLDLHPRVFGQGRCAQTMLARAQVVLLSLTDIDQPSLDGPAYWIMVRSSFAGYLADWLLDAATEYLAPGNAVP